MIYDIVFDNVAPRLFAMSELDSEEESTEWHDPPDRVA